MIEEDRIWHYVRGNKTSKQPRRHIFLDCEATRTRGAKNHTQRWMLGAAAFRTAEKGRRPKDSLVQYDMPADLWADVEAFCRPRNRTILWAHNLAYDVRISDAFRVLPARGWMCTAHNLANRGTWISWSKGALTLLMVDSQSVYPVPLETLGKHFLRPKMPLPSDADSRAMWMARCVRDVEILRDAIVTYLDWLEKEDLGTWQMTGAGQSYAAFRQRFMTHSMLVHADVDALATERRAMWTGRCEAYYRGRIGREGMEEWDLSLAYARIARDQDIPTRLIGSIDGRYDLPALLARKRAAVLADVEITTDVPIAPSKLDGRMVWPVGRFRTTLWTPELALALDVGAHVVVERAYLYATQPALKAWATWVIDTLADRDNECPAWRRIILHHWARALIGRFGMQYTAWERYGVTEDLRVMYSHVYDPSTQDTYALSHVGTGVQRATGEVEWGQSQPAITGYVMSACRARLYRIMQAIGPRRVLYADTDSVYVRPEHHALVAAIAATPLGEGLRLKGRHRRATILGPRQIVTDGRARIAGIPSQANRLPNGAYHGEVWMSLEQSMRRGTPSAVITTDRTWKVSGLDRRRVLGPDGWTHPIAVGGGEISD